MRAVIYTTEQYGLVAERDTCISDFAASFGSFRRHFFGVVEMCVEPNRVIFFEHVDQIVGYSHWHYHGGSGSESYDFNMRWAAIASAI